MAIIFTPYDENDPQKWLNDNQAKMLKIKAVLGKSAYQQIDPNVIKNAQENIDYYEKIKTRSQTQTPTGTTQNTSPAQPQAREQKPMSWWEQLGQSWKNVVANTGATAVASARGAVHDVGLLSNISLTPQDVMNRAAEPFTGKKQTTLLNQTLQPILNKSDKFLQGQQTGFELESQRTKKNITNFGVKALNLVGNVVPQMAAIALASASKNPAMIDYVLNAQMAQFGLAKQQERLDKGSSEGISALAGLTDMALFKLTSIIGTKANVQSWKNLWEKKYAEGGQQAIEDLYRVAKGINITELDKQTAYRLGGSMAVRQEIEKTAQSFTKGAISKQISKNFGNGFIRGFKQGAVYNAGNYIAGKTADYADGKETPFEPLEFAKTVVEGGIAMGIAQSLPSAMGAYKAYQEGLDIRNRVNTAKESTSDENFRQFLIKVAPDAMKKAGKGDMVNPTAPVGETTVPVEEVKPATNNKTATTKPVKEEIIPEIDSEEALLASINAEKQAFASRKILETPQTSAKPQNAKDPIRNALYKAIDLSVPEELGKSKSKVTVEIKKEVIKSVTNGRTENYHELNPEEKAKLETLLTVNGKLNSRELHPEIKQAIETGISNYKGNVPVATEQPKQVEPVKPMATPKPKKVSTPKETVVPENIKVLQDQKKGLQAELTKENRQLQISKASMSSLAKKGLDTSHARTAFAESKKRADELQLKIDELDNQIMEGGLSNGKMQAEVKPVTKQTNTKTPKEGKQVAPATENPVEVKQSAKEQGTAVPAQVTEKAPNIPETSTKGQETLPAPNEKKPIPASQMTQKEVFKHLIEFHKEKKTKVPSDTTYKQIIDKKTGEKREVPVYHEKAWALDENQKKIAIEMHRRAIKLALEQGFTVPEDVLKDYPDLQQEATNAKETGKSNQGGGTQEGTQGGTGGQIRVWNNAENGVETNTKSKTEEKNIVSVTGKKGKELVLGRLHNAMIRGGMKLGDVDATIKVITDLIEGFHKQWGLEDNLDTTFDKWLQTVAYVNGSITKDNLQVILEKLSLDVATKYQGSDNLIRGIFHFSPDGKAGMIFGKDMNATTPMHEFAHSYEKMMELASLSNPDMKLIYDGISQWLGVEPYKWTSEAREQFAGGFLTRLYEGITKPGDVGNAYMKMQSLITDIWKDVSNNEFVEMPKSVKDLYDVLFGLKDVKQVFPKRVSQYAKDNKGKILANGTRGSPKTLFDIFKNNPNYRMVKSRDHYDVTFSGKQFQMVNNKDHVLVDGIVCKSPSEVLVRVSQVMSNTVPVETYLSFQTKEAGAKAIAKSNQKSMNTFNKNVEKHMIGLVNALRGKISLPTLRSAMKDIVKDSIIKKYKIDPRNNKENALKYREAVRDATGFITLDDLTTFELMRTMEQLDTGSLDAYFGSDFFKLLPTVVSTMQTATKRSGRLGEELVLRSIFEVMSRYPVKIKNSAIVTRVARSSNMLIAKMGRQGTEVLSRAVDGHNWHDRMLAKGEEITYNIKKIFMDWDKSNKLGRQYFYEEQMIAAGIVIKAMELDVPEEEPRASHENALIESLVADNNKKALAGERNYYEVNAEDVKSIAKQCRDLFDYFRLQIETLNAKMKRSVIGVQRNYFIRSYLGVPVTKDSRLFDVNGKFNKNPNKILHVAPGSARERTSMEEAGQRNTDLLEMTGNYVYGMAKYIAYYDLVDYCNNKLPLKTSQIFNTGYERPLVEYVNGIIGYGDTIGDLDLLIRASRSNLTSVALSWNVAMVGLNFIQRHLSNMFVSPDVWLGTNELVNHFTGNLYNPDKHPMVQRALEHCQVTGKSLYMETIDKFHRHDDPKTNSRLIKLYLKLTKASEWNLEKSAFMSTERANWAFAYVAGILQTAMTSNKFRTEFAKTQDKWGSIEHALTDDSVFQNAILSAQVINASVNCDPSAVFSQQYFTHNNFMHWGLWFLRFFVNMVNIVGVESNPFITNKNNWAPGIFNTILHGTNIEKEQASNLQIMNSLCDMFSKENRAKMFKKQHMIAGEFTSQDFDNASKALNQMREGLRKTMNTGNDNLVKINGSKLVFKNAISLLGYMSSEFLIWMLVAYFKQFQHKVFSKYLLSPSTARRKLANDKKDIPLKSLMNVGGLTRIFSPMTFASGMMPTVPQYNMTSGKAWFRAFTRWQENMIPVLGIPNMILTTLTGISSDEILADQIFSRHNKNPHNKPSTPWWEDREVK